MAARSKLKYCSEESSGGGPEGERRLAVTAWALVDVLVKRVLYCSTIFSERSMPMYCVAKPERAEVMVPGPHA